MGTGVTPILWDSFVLVLSETVLVLVLDFPGDSSTSTSTSTALRAEYEYDSTKFPFFDLSRWVKESRSLHVVRSQGSA